MSKISPSSNSQKWSNPSTSTCRINQIPSTYPINTSTNSWCPCSIFTRQSQKKPNQPQIKTLSTTSWEKSINSTSPLPNAKIWSMFLKLDWKSTPELRKLLKKRKSKNTKPTQTSLHQRSWPPSVRTLPNGIETWSHCWKLNLISLTRHHYKSKYTGVHMWHPWETYKLKSKLSRQSYR